MSVHYGATDFTCVDSVNACLYSADNFLCVTCAAALVSVQELLASRCTLLPISLPLGLRAQQNLMCQRPVMTTCDCRGYCCRCSEKVTSFCFNAQIRQWYQLPERKQISVFLKMPNYLMMYISVFLLDYREDKLNYSLYHTITNV